MPRAVLFTASTYSHLARFHLPYFAAFRSEGWWVDAACGGAPLALPGTERVFEIPFVKHFLSPRNMQAAARLRGVIRSGGYDLIITHTSLAAFFTRLAVRGLSEHPAVVCMVHGYLFDEDTPFVKREILQAAEALAAPVTDLVLTMNQWDEQYARAHCVGKRVARVPGIGVDFSRLYRGKRDDLRQSLGYGPDDFLLIYPAEFSGRKNQSFLLHALAALPERVKLLLPGDGTLREQCVQLAGRLGVLERAVFPGDVREIAEWYAAADCAVSASRSEGLPFHVMEGMYCGLPVVASAVKGNVDLIRDGQNGFLYPFDDQETFQRQIGVLLTDPELVEHLGRQAEQDAEQYALAAVLPRVMEQYWSVLK